MIVAACGAPQPSPPSNVSNAPHATTSMVACYADTSAANTMMRRRVDPASHTIVFEWFVDGSRSETVTYAVDGDRFTGPHERGELDGPTWHWLSWHSTYEVPHLTKRITGVITPAVLLTSSVATLGSRTVVRRVTYRAVDCAELPLPKLERLIDI
ncbi:MAG TPA: hypothetical protein VGG28_15075 [Kofleriaceae bacterium]|jgi:hypothetical protein